MVFCRMAEPCGNSCNVFVEFFMKMRLFNECVRLGADKLIAAAWSDEKMMEYIKSTWENWHMSIMNHKSKLTYYGK